jgi:hypothetical protein
MKEDFLRVEGERLDEQLQRLQEIEIVLRLL